MAKLTAWLVALLGVILVLGLIPGIGFNWSTMWVQWVIAIAVLVIGVGKVIRNYSMMKKK